MKFKLRVTTKNIVIIGAIILIMAIAFCVFLFIKKNANESSWKKAEDYYKNGQYTKVTDLIKDQDLPEDSTKLNIYGHSYLAVGKLDQAYSAYNKLYETDKSLDAKLIMANIKLQQGDKSAAEKFYQDIIQTNASFIQAYLNLANLYRGDGRLEKAVETLKQANRVNPTNTAIIEYYLSINTENKNSEEYKSWAEKLKSINKKWSIANE